VSSTGLSLSLSLSLKQPLPHLHSLLLSMFGFGDKLTEGGYRIPWLIWIRILVLFLLIFLLFCFSFFPSDLSDTTTSSSSALPSAVGVFMLLNSHLDKQTLKHKNRGRRRADRGFYPRNKTASFW